MDQEIPDLLNDKVKGNEPVLANLSKSINNFKSQTVTEASEVVAGEVHNSQNIGGQAEEVLA